MHRRLLAWLFGSIAATAALPAAAHAYADFFVFGDSLSDTGNNAAVLPFRTTGVPNDAFIPFYPYDSNRYSNDRVWTEAFAGALGLDASPSLAGGNIYAFGGATTGTGTVPPNLRDQVNLFLALPGPAQADQLFVIAGGGNNARDALASIQGGGNPATVIPETAAAFAGDIGAMLGNLRADGAQSFIVWTVPNVGITPAILSISDPAQRAAAVALGNSIASAMNQALFGLLALDPLGSQVRVYDLYAEFGKVVANAGDDGLANVTNACGAAAGCDPSTYLFWDGIHPTSAGHAIIAQGMVAAAVPEPETVVLLVAGLLVLGLALRSRAR